jgi:hypothetical protein
MATTLGTKLGTMLGTELADFLEPAPTPPTIASLLPLVRYRASQAATSGGNVVNIPNEGTAGGTLDVFAGTLAAPTADAALLSAPSVSFTGAQDLRASLGASSFTFLHDGTPCTAYLIGVATLAQALVATTYATPTTSVGFRCNIALTNTTFAQSNGVNTPPPLQLTATGATTGAGYCVRALVSGGQGSQYRNGALVLGPSAPTASLSSAAPGYTLSIGRIPNGGAFTNGSRFAELIAFDRALTAPELAIVDAEMFATYGVHA